MFQRNGIYSHKGLHRWAKKVHGGDVLKLDMVLIPVALGSHWTLCVADITNKAISC